MNSFDALNRVNPVLYVRRRVFGQDTEWPDGPGPTGRTGPNDDLIVTFIN